MPQVDAKSISEWSKAYFDKLKEDLKIKKEVTSDVIEASGDVIDVAKEIADDPLGSLREAQGTVTSFMIVAFLYITLGLIILFSLYQVFRSSPTPARDLSKVGKKTVTKGKKVVSKIKNKRKNKGVSSNGNKSK